MTNIKVVKNSENITTISQACNTYNLSRFRVKNNQSTSINYGKVYKIIQLNNFNSSNKDYRLIDVNSHYESRCFCRNDFKSLSQFIEYLINNDHEVYIAEGNEE